MDQLVGLHDSVANCKGMMPSVINELFHHRANPRFLLVLTCSFAELLVGTMIEEHCKNGKQINSNSRDFSFSVRLVLLREMNLLDDSSFTRLNWLRKRRNSAAHDPGFRFTKDMIPEWAGKLHTSADDLFSICVNVIGPIWNSNTELFLRQLPVENSFSDVSHDNYKIKKL